MQIATLWHVILRAAQDWWNDNCLRLAASLSYYTALSMAPLVLLIVGVVGLVLDRQQAIHQLTAQIEGLMGAAGREVVTSILTTTSPQEGVLATTVGLVTLFIGATAVFGELQATMNLIWEVQPAPTSGIWAGIWFLLRERLFSLAIVFALAFLLLVSLIISTALATVAAWFQGPEQALLSRLLEVAVSLEPNLEAPPFGRGGKVWPAAGRHLLC
jgi:membrane protein